MMGNGRPFCNSYVLCWGNPWDIRDLDLLASDPPKYFYLTKLAIVY